MKFGASVSSVTVTSELKTFSLHHCRVEVPPEEGFIYEPGGVFLRVQHEAFWSFRRARGTVRDLRGSVKGDVHQTAS
ncbi:hypothetical protein OJAV_G00115070 [Oryzias javanicus]|uniref:Uncharacterized protein n=1 Tax=Oryzias javanicus TaxID=123683 RepID=A0A3S2MUH8_ORYJA|nr:hypothetical protein OJAV_G00115070 [Oryzias javanicus]